MENISYQIFDKKSNLPVIPYSDKNIRQFAFLRNESISETYFKFKKEMKVIYGISKDKKSIYALSGGKLSKRCKDLIYFDDYDEAVSNLEY